MTGNNPQVKERRHSVQSMTDAQFREFCMQHFDAGTACMNELRELITENNRITNETKEGTSAIVSIVSFSENSARRVVKIGRFLSMLAKGLLPFFALYAMIKAIQLGHFPSWRDFL